MKFSTIISSALTLASLVSATISQQKILANNGVSSNNSSFDVDDVKAAARLARTLVHRESLADCSALDVSTNIPTEFTEYYVDALDNGNPVLILIGMSSTHRNVNHTQSQEIKTSISIRTGNHSPWDQLYDWNISYPGSLQGSMVGSPRLSLIGEFKELTAASQEEISIKEQFGQRHPDARMWFPNQKLSAHPGSWYTFEVESVYLLGGFGNMAFIGNISLEEYKNAVPYTEQELIDLEKQANN